MKTSEKYILNYMTNEGTTETKLNQQKIVDDDHVFIVSSIS